MAEELASWERPQYKPGGGDPLLFLAIYGKIREPLPLSRMKYHSNGTPSGIRISKFTNGDSDGVFASFLEAPFGEILDGTQPDLAPKVRAAPECTVIKGTVKDPATLDYLRDVIGIAACMLDGGGIAVLDMQTLQWWDGADWKREMFETDFDPGQHVALLGSEEPDGTAWMRTRGMRKFGRPDMSIHHVTEALQEPVVQLCNQYIAMQVAGAVIPEGEAVEIEGIPKGTTAHHGGSHDDPEFNNVHLEIRLGK